jgi:hypothetical protein
MKEMTYFPFQNVPIRISCKIPTLKLDWSYSKPAKGASKDAEILINGKNNTDQAITLVGVAFTLNSEPSGHGLTTGTDFKNEKWTIGKPDGTKSNIFQIVKGADGTAAFTSVTAVVGEKTSEGITHVTISGTGNVSIAPGSSITLALLTGTGVPDTYTVFITETWPKVESMASQSLARPVKVILSP